MIRVALLSRWHVHADEYAQEACKHPDVEVVAVWDEQETRGRKWAKELGVRFESDLEQLLGDDTVDAVIVATPTTMHLQVIVATARHRKHVFTEKVMGVTLEEVRLMLAEMANAERRWMLSLPRLSHSYFL